MTAVEERVKYTQYGLLLFVREILSDLVALKLGSGLERKVSTCGERIEKQEGCSLGGRQQIPFHF